MTIRRMQAPLLGILLILPYLAVTGCGSDTSTGKLSTANIAAGDSRADPAAGKADLANHPLVLIKTSVGDIKLRLDRNKSPVTVDNFLDNYVQREHYDQTIFHYVDKDFMILGGGYTPRLEVKPTRTEILNEADNGLKNHRGTIAMARDPEYKDSATSQFFINLAENPSLDHIDRDSNEQYGYCVFGKVIEGLDVVDRIAKVKVHDTEGFTKIPVQPVIVQSIRQIR